MKTKLLAQVTRTASNGYSTFCTLIRYGANIVLRMVEADYNGKIVETREYTWLNTPQLVLVAKSYMELETAK